MKNIGCRAAAPAVIIIYKSRNTTKSRSCSTEEHTLAFVCVSVFPGDPTSQVMLHHTANISGISDFTTTKTSSTVESRRSRLPPQTNAQLVRRGDLDRRESQESGEPELGPAS